MRLSRLFALINCLLWVAALAQAQIRVLIVDGVNNHDWAAGTAGIRSILDEAGGFRVDVSTVTPEKFDQWNPNFAKYQVVVNNFNGGHTDKESSGPGASRKRSRLMSKPEEDSSLTTLPTTHFCTGPPITT